MTTLAMRTRGTPQLYELADDTKHRVARMLAAHKKTPDIIRIEAQRFHALVFSYNGQLDTGFTRNYDAEQWELHGVYVQKASRDSGIHFFYRCC